MISRNQFSEIIDKVFGDKLEDFIDKIFESFDTQNYKGFYHEETVFIIDLNREVMITWYKAYHIGRDLKITYGESDADYVSRVFSEIKKELGL